MVKPKTTIAGRLENSSGEWTLPSCGDSNHYPCGYFVTFGLCQHPARCESKSRICANYAASSEPLHHLLRQVSADLTNSGYKAHFCYPGRKISGTGAAQIDDMMILVGNFIQDFNYEMMSKCLRVPDEKFRDKVYRTMYENLTTFQRETGKIQTIQDFATDVLPRFEALLGK